MVSNTERLQDTDGSHEPVKKTVQDEVEFEDEDSFREYLSQLFVTSREIECDTPYKCLQFPTPVNNHNTHDAVSTQQTLLMYYYRSQGGSEYVLTTGPVCVLDADSLCVATGSVCVLVQSDGGESLIFHMGFGVYMLFCSSSRLFIIAS